MLIFYFCLGILFFLLILYLVQLSFSFKVDILHNGYRLVIETFFMKQKKQYNLKFSLSNLLTVINQENNKDNTNPGESLKGLFSKLELIPEYFSLLNRVLRYMVVKRVDWRTSLGLDDAMNTALSSGGLWALKGIIISVLSSKSSIEDLILDVQPDYANIGLGSRFECIFKLRLVHIIIIGIYLLSFLIKRNIKLLSNRLINNGGIFKWIRNKKSSSSILLKD